MNKPVVAIIGGGFCGMMTAANLCKKTALPVDIKIINSNYSFANGIAYSAHTLKYLLNVPAENMGAFADKRTDFTEWLIANHFYKEEEKIILNKTFQPRKLYGLYLKDVWKQVLDSKPAFVDVEVINDFAEDIEAQDNGYKIRLKNSNALTAEIVVLSTGNSQPQQLLIDGHDLCEFENYFANPWSVECVGNVKNLNSILIVGNGLTMIDTVLGLKENGFSGTIFSVSPNGFSLMPHRHVDTKYTLLRDELKDVTTLKKLRSIVYRHIIKVRNFGLSPELVTDALRSLTQALWQQFSKDEKRTFLKELSYQWNVVRHRTPHHIYDYLLKLKDEKKFVPYTGNIKSFTVDNANDKAQLTINNKLSGSSEQLTVERIINCTGPNTDLKKSGNTLLRNLATKGFIAADEFNLGILTGDEDYSIVDAKHINHKNILTLGSSLKGKLWESVAIPELREQAAATANFILKRVEQLQKA